jgi:hypothetical protein
MTQILQPNFQLLYNEARLAALYQALDELHSAASEERLNTVTTLNKIELLGWLHDFVYTAQETIAEIEGGTCSEKPGISLVQKSVS